MSSFLETVEEIKNRNYILEEFPLVSRDIFPEDCLKKAMLIKEDMVFDYAVSLKNKEIDGLLLDIVSSENDEEIDRVSKIINIRISKRIVKLISYLSQYNYQSKSIDLIIKNIIGLKNSLYNSGYLSRFAKADDKIEYFKQTLGKFDDDIHKTFTKYQISEKSPLALQVQLKFFADCEKNSFFINETVFCLLIKTTEKDRTIGVIKNYLDKLSVTEYIDEVNLIIISIFGKPDELSNWQEFDKSIKDKFLDWIYLYNVKRHCQGNKKKFKSLFKYFEHVKSVYEISDDILVIDFGELLVAGQTGEINSFLYEKNLFNNEIDTLEEFGILPTMLDENRDIMTAREFMLSDSDSGIIKLGFDDVDFYYSQEVLDIKLALEPDMRVKDVK